MTRQPGLYRIYVLGGDGIVNIDSGNYFGDGSAYIAGDEETPRATKLRTVLMAGSTDSTVFILIGLVLYKVEQYLVSCQL
mgnify:CR=1 FL=1